MATETEIRSLRRAANVDLEDETYTSAILGGMIDDLGSIEAAAAAIWKEKAAASAELVDTTESGSSRRLSQIHDQAKAMASFWETAADGGTSSGHGSFTVGIARV